MAARAFPAAIVGLLGSGIYLAHDAGWGFSSAWIVTGLVGLFLIAAVGDALNARQGKRLEAAIGRGDEAGVRALLAEPLPRFASLLPTALMFGIVYAMTVKPGPLGCALALAIPLVLAALVVPRLLATAAAQRVEAPAAAETL